MTSLRTLSAAAVALAAVISLAGCTEDEAAAPAVDGPTAGAEPARDPEVEKALAQLSPADRALAEKQGVCPVTGEPLGSMGQPIKVTVDGQEVFVCCEGCVDALKENPEKHLAKLKNNAS